MKLHKVALSPCFYLLVLLFLSPEICTANPVIVVDAGSSHTGVQVYDVKQGRDLPNVYLLSTHDVDLALSTYADHVQDIPAYEQAVAATFPKNLPDHTPIYIMATAGMRLLPNEQQQAIYQALTNAVNADQRVSLQYAGTISGQQEGVYAWLSVNYLSDTLGKGAHETLGVIDMGGASTQIVFANTYANNENDEVELNIGPMHYRLFAHSFLGMGQNEARKASANAQCFPRGLALDNQHTGDFYYPGCRHKVNEYLENYDIEYIVPSVANMKFIGISGYYYTLSFFHAADDQTNLAQKVWSACQRDWSAIKAENPDIPEKFLKNNCFSGVYINAVLNHYHNLVAHNQLHVSDAIKRTQIDWTLGALLAKYSD